MPPPIGAVTVHPERAEDRAVVTRLLCDACGRGNEAQFVETLRLTRQFVPALSLVAVRRAEVIGFALFTRVPIMTPAGVLSAVALAPLAVAPAHQREGVGPLLARDGLQRAATAGYPVALALGLPQFYPKIGFQVARAFELEPTLSIPPGLLFAQELRPGVLGAGKGTVVLGEVFSVLLG